MLSVRSRHGNRGVGRKDLPLNRGEDAGSEIHGLCGRSAGRPHGAEGYRLLTEGPRSWQNCLAGWPLACHCYRRTRHQCSRPGSGFAMPHSFQFKGAPSSQIRQCGGRWGLWTLTLLGLVSTGVHIGDDAIVGVGRGVAMFHEEHR